MAAVVPAGGAQAASLTVTTTADSIDAAGSRAAVTLASLPGPGGQTTLREAVCAANKNPAACSGRSGWRSPAWSSECSLDDAAFSACTSPVTLTGLSIGTHTFHVRAVDAAGNADPTPASATWTITAAPTPTSPTTVNPITAPLPATGASHVQTWLAVGCLLVAAAVILTQARRRTA